MSAVDRATDARIMAVVEGPPEDELNTTRYLYREGNRTLVIERTYRNGAIMWWHRRWDGQRTVRAYGITGPAEMEAAFRWLNGAGRMAEERTDR